MKKIVIALLLLSSSYMHAAGEAGSPPQKESDNAAFNIAITWGVVSITSLWILWLIASRK